MSSGLRALFADLDAPGVKDVLRYAGTLSDMDRALLARAVVDTIAQVTADE